MKRVFNLLLMLLAIYLPIHAYVEEVTINWNNYTFKAYLVFEAHYTMIYGSITDVWYEFHPSKSYAAISNFRGLSEEVTVPETVEVTTSVHFPPSFSYQPEDVSVDCSLEVSSILTNAFKDNTILTTLICPGIKQFEENALANHETLEKVVLGCDAIIGENAFMNCINLKEVSWEHVAIAKAGAFQNCSSITGNLDLRGFKYGDSTIGERAFAGLTEVTQLIWPENSISVASGAFDGCTALYNVATPYFQSISTDAFSNCPSLRFPIVFGIQGNPGCPSECLFTDNSTGDFNNMTKLQTAVLCTFAETNPEIDGCIFDGCSALDNLYLSNSNCLAYRASSKVSLPSSDVTVFIDPGTLSIYKKQPFWKSVENFYELSNFTVIPTAKKMVLEVGEIQPYSNLCFWVNDEQNAYGWNMFTEEDLPEEEDGIASVTLDGITNTSLLIEGLKEGTTEYVFYYNYVDENGTEQSKSVSLQVEVVESINSVSDIMSGESYDTEEIYSLNGIKINTTIDNLNQGVYIIRKGATVKKIVVK